MACLRRGGSVAGVGRIVFGLLLVIAPAREAAQAEEMMPEVKVVAPTEGLAGGSLALEAESETGSRLGLSVRETPASVEIISGEVIRQRGDATTQSAVTRATGIASAATPGNGSTALAARGFAGHGSVMQLYDGSRLYVGAGTVTFPVDTWPLARIEVLRGPASVLYGEGAIGAAVNYIPKKPNRTRSEHEALISAGSWETYRVGLGSGGPLSASAAYRLDISGTTSNGFVDRADSERYTLAGKLLFDVTEALTLILAVDGSKADDPRYWGTPLINGAIDPRTRRLNYNVFDSVVHYEDLWTRLKAEWRAAPNVTVRNELYRFTTDRHWRNLENYTFQPGTGLIRRTGFLEIFHDQTQTGNRLQAALDNTLFNRRNRLLVGFDVNHIRFQHTNNSPFGGTSDVDPFVFDPGFFVNLAGTTPRFRTRTRQYSVFAEDALDLTERVKLVAGARNDQIDFERTDLVTGDAFDKTFNPSTWRLGAVVELTSALALYAQTSTGVDPLTSLITLAPAQREFALATGRQHEVGAKYAFLDGRGEATLALYNIAKKNLLSRDPTDPTRTVQVGRQSSRGMEVALGLRPTPRWSLDANLALLEAKFDEFVENVGGTAVSRAGNLPPNVPEQVANLWISHRVAIAWDVGAGARYVGTRFANNANTVRIPGYTVADAFVAWNAGRNTTLTLRARNLFDRQYAIASYNAGTQFILGDPRAFEFSLSAVF